MKVEKILVCKDEEKIYIKLVSGDIEQTDSYNLADILNRFKISSYDAAIKSGILREVALDDSEYQELKEQYADKYYEDKSYNIRYNQALELYLRLRNNYFI